MIALRQFLLLMWKHFHLRKHRWFLTSVEIILPIAIAYLLCSVGGKFLGESPTILEATNGSEENFKEIMTRTPYLKIMYTPENVFTKDLMSKAKEYAGFQQIEAAQNEQELEKFVAMNSTGNLWIGIVFLNSENAGSKPSKLNYKIRNALSWDTDKLFVETNRPGPYKDDWYFSRGFAGIQIALDMAFIRGWNADFNYSKYIFRSFPYPEYQKVNGIREYAPLLMVYVVILTSLILSVPLISNIIDEKETGVKELMKLNGLKEWVLQVSWFVNAIIFNLISFSIAVFILQYDFNGPQTGVLLNVPALIVWTCIVLYCISNIAFCFTFTAIFHSLTVASSIFILFFCLMVFLSSKFYSMNSWILIRLSCLFPVGALYQGFQRIIFFENQQKKVTWSTLGKVEAGTEGVSLLFAFVMLIFDTFFYLLLSQYISAINPGTFGSRKSPLFFLRGLSFYPSNNGDINHLHSSTELQETKYFEKTLHTLQISISIKNLYKYFGSLSAVKNVNLDIYKGEITALLGHNGAGKTTTMAILTGMMKPTTGYITYQNRIDVLKYMTEFRKNVGLCPQENRLFPYLSVMNHLIFFGMVRMLFT